MDIFFLFKSKKKNNPRPHTRRRMAKRTVSQRKQQEEEGSTAAAAVEDPDQDVEMKSSPDLRQAMNSSSGVDGKSGGGGGGEGGGALSSFGKQQPSRDPAQAVRDKKAIESLVQTFGVKANEIVHVSCLPLPKLGVKREDPPWFGSVHSIHPRDSIFFNPWDGWNVF